MHKSRKVIDVMLSVVRIRGGQGELLEMFASDRTDKVTVVRLTSPVDELVPQSQTLSLVP